MQFITAMQNCNTTFRLSKLKRPLEGGDTETIFAALSGTFDQAFEVFFSSLGAALPFPPRVMQNQFTTHFFILFGCIL
jgi:hypothetical protein